MIHQLKIHGFTIFAQEANFSFVPGMNIIVGGNDSGKSHLLKLSYALTKWMAAGGSRRLPDTWAEEQRLCTDLLRVFGTQELSSLSAHSREATQLATVAAELSGDKVPLGHANLAFQFERTGESSLHITTMPDRFLHEHSIFITPREVLSIYPCYMQVGKRYPELMDGASWELCRALEREPVSPFPSGPMQQVLREIEALLGGDLRRVHGRFSLQRPHQDPIELNLIAEGFKRLGMLGLLIANGSISPGTSLYWDEPEMNLNASHLPALVSIMLGLCEAGVQVLISTHSLFLLRELVILLSRPERAPLTRRFFGMQAEMQGTQRHIRFSCGEQLEDLDELDILAAEVEQADRYLGLA